MELYKEGLITAIIITYKRPLEILKRAIYSALNQTYKKIEVIVVNDNPKDLNGSEAICNLIKSINDDRLKYVAHKKNGGACKARNTGIKASNGKFVALLDDDDEWLPNKLECQLEGFTSDNVGMVYSPYYNIRVDGSIQRVRVGLKSGDILEDLLWSNFVGGSSMTLIRKDVFEKCGYFDETLLSSQDYDMWMRIAKEYEVNFVDEYLTNRYMQEESISFNLKKQQQGFNAFTKKFESLYLANPRAYNYRLVNRVGKWIEQGHFREAREMYLEAIHIRILSIYNITEPLKGLLKYIKYGRRTSK